MLRRLIARPSAATIILTNLPARLHAALSAVLVAARVLLQAATACNRVSAVLEC